MSASIKRLVTVVAVAGAVALIWLVQGFVQGSRTTELTAEFDSTIGLYPGSDVRMLGVTVGSVKAVEPDGGHVDVTMELDPEFAAAADTGAVIVAPTLVSDRYVQLTKPHVGGEALKSGATIERARTAVPVEVDDLYASLTDIATKLGPEGANANGALSDLLTTAAENLDGNGSQINTALKEFGKATATLAESDEAFFGTLANLKEFNDMLVENDDDVAALNRQFDTVAGYLADDRDDMASAITEMAEAMAVLDDFIADNREHLRTSVDNLTGPTQTLVDQKKSLEEAVRLIPVALQNFLNAYNVGANTVDGRSNLNELGIWSTNGLSGSTSGTALPSMLPGMDEGDR